MSLCRVIIHSTVRTEKRLMINLQAAREAYESLAIDCIGHIKASDNVAYGTTKHGSFPSVDQLIENGKVNSTVLTVIDSKFVSVDMSSSEHDVPSELNSGECDQWQLDTEKNSNNIYQQR